MTNDPTQTTGERQLICALAEAVSGWMAVADAVAAVLDKKGSSDLAQLLRERIAMDAGPLKILAEDPEFLAAIKRGAGKA